MILICPHCNMVQTYEKDKDYCNGCEKDLKWVHLIIQKSNSYYAIGYRLAKERKLSKAATYMRKAVSLYKYNTHAHNVLGLIYFEQGRMGKAFKQWILSATFQKEDNDANRYIDELRNKQRLIGSYKQCIDLYNKSILYLKKGNEDMAIIRLKKCISLQSKFLDARVLLALCYIEQKKYTRAMEQIKEVLSIDQAHPIALDYFSYLNRDQKDTPISEEELIEERVRKVEPIYMGEAISTKVSRFRIGLLYFVIGMIGMFGISYLMIIPSKTKVLELQIAQIESAAENDRARLRNTLDELEKELEDLKSKNKELTSQKEELQNLNGKLSQQNKLKAAQALSQKYEWVEAGEILYNIQAEFLEDEEKKVYETLKQSVLPKATERIYYKALELMNQKEYVEAFAGFEKAQLYVPGHNLAGNSLYYMGYIQEQTGNNEKAMSYYETVCADYEGNWIYYSAKERLNKLKENE